MKAVRQHRDGSLEVGDVPTPSCPPGGVLVRVGACGICGTDVRAWHNGHRAATEEIIPGHEIAGVVAEADDNALGLRVGDRVAIAPDVSCGACHYCLSGLGLLCLKRRAIGVSGLDGGLAEYIALTLDVMRHGCVHRMPEGLDFADGVLAETLSSVLACAERLVLGQGSTVAVVGAGPIACLHVNVLGGRGLRTILIGRSQARVDAARRVTRADAYLSGGVEMAGQGVLDATDGLGADAVVIAAANPAAVAPAVALVRRRGQVVLFAGLAREASRVALDLNTIHYDELTLFGSFSYPPAMHELALDWIAAQRVPARDYVTHRFPLDAVHDAYEVAGRGAGALKVVIEPGGGARTTSSEGGVLR